MRIEKRNRLDERKILTAMIVDNIVVARIATKWTPQGLFKTKYANLIGQWCVDFYARYGKAPMNNVESFYESWAQKTPDKHDVKNVERFLGDLDSEYEELQKISNSDYVTDVAGRYFNQIRIEKLNEIVEGHLQSGRIEDANQAINDFHRIELGVGEGIDVFHDEQAIKEAFSTKRKPLVNYKGALGEFFRGALERDALVAFMAPEKRGKSFWLIDVAYRAMSQGRKVAYFEAGDNSRGQVIRRLMTRVSRKPMKRSLIHYPTGMKRDIDDEIATVTKMRKRFKVGLDYLTAWKACKKFTKSKIKSEGSLFKLSCHANSTLSVKMIKNILSDWEREGWVPDVIVIDYADILNMDSSVFEGRDRINETWKGLRSLSQLCHSLVITATQADAASYTRSTINKSNFSEDKRKLSHVTGIIGINQTPNERTEQIMRLNWVVLREDEYNEEECVHVATCLGLANPAVKSCK